MLETRIDAVDFLAQLDEEVVMAYDVTDETITNIVIALLAMQIHTTPITLGTIEPVVTRSILIEDQQDSILGVLSKLRETVGGYIEVDTSRQLNWWNDIGEDKGQQIRYKKNVKGLSRTLEFTNFGNRLYCYGAGEGSARIHLDDAIGMTEDYVESIPSQGTYGMCIRQLTDKSITDPDVLLAWANLKLAEMIAPMATYRVDMVNLAAMGWTFEALQLGSIVKVIDEDLVIDLDARIVKVIRDLSNPENIQVEISNVTLDFIDTSRGVYDTQQFYDHIATKIGAGQVVVLGDFYVSDWVTGGTTLIKGDYVRSGLLESTNWGVGAGSQFNLNDGTFKLGGSAAPKLSWNGTVLAVTGTIYATAGEFTGTLKVTNIESGKTLTVNGTISAGGGGVLLDTSGIEIIGNAQLIRFFATTPVGTPRALIQNTASLLFISTNTGYIDLNSAADLWLTAVGKLFVSAATSIDFANVLYMDLPGFTFAQTPAVLEGRFGYNKTSHVLQYHNGTSWKVVATV